MRTPTKNRPAGQTPQCVFRVYCPFKASCYKKKQKTNKLKSVDQNFLHFIHVVEFHLFSIIVGVNPSFPFLAKLRAFLCQSHVQKHGRFLA